MSEQQKSQQRSSRLEFLSESGIWDKSHQVKYLIGFLFMFLVFGVIHLKDVRMENFELDAIAQRYAVAEVDFNFHDEEATILSQQEALRDIGWLYVVDEKYLEQRRREFKRHLRDQDSWRYMLTSATFDDLYTAVNLVFEACRQTNYTNPRTYQKMQQLGLHMEGTYVLTGINDHEALRIPPKVWDDLMRTAFEGKGVPLEAQRFAMEYFEDEPWRFEVDVTAQRHLREQILAQVPPKSLRIKAGSHILDQGERVTQRHLNMFKAMKDALKSKSQLGKPIPMIGTFILSMLVMALSGKFLRIFYKPIFYSNRSLFLIFVIFFFTVAFAEGVEKVLMGSLFGGLDVIDISLFIPFISIICSCLFPLGASLFISVMALIVLTASLPVDGYIFTTMNIMAMLVAVTSRRNMSRRKYVFLTCAKIWFAACLVFTGMYLYNTGGIKVDVFQDYLFLLAMMAVTAAVIVILLPILENSFKIMTEMTLMDYLDPNVDLLRRLSIEAPGTYQHSLLVAHLAECAASVIGARALFCRVSSLYHDIGKLAFPHYFAENQQGVNVHQLLTPLESAQVIIAHVSEGVTLARKHNLPEPFIDIIKEHHGTSLVYYFYKKAEDLKEEGEVVDKKDFRYCGPKPRSKEAVIVMLSDCLEAGSRALDEITEESLTTLMDSIVKTEIADAQLENSPLTLQELSKVRKCLVKTMLAASHSRVKYPKRNLDGS